MKAAHPELAAATGQHPGERLRQARESRGWTQADVASKLNLTVSSLNHLETGAFDRLPGHTFARGYIRAYAKLLDLDQAPLVDAFDHHTGTHAKGSDVHSLGRIEEPMRLSHNILRGVSLLLLLAVVGGGFAWWQDQGGTRKDAGSLAMEHVEVESADGTTQIHPLDEPEDQAVVAGAQPESAPLALPQATDEASTGTPAPSQGTAPVAAASAAATASSAPAAPAVTQPAVTPAPPATAASPAATPVAGQGQLTIAFSADCWTQVSDATGKVLSSGVKRKGDRLELSGKPPLSVRLGFARGAQVSYNGQAVDTAPFTSGQTARLKLGQ
ncbi:helix-turn-helix domain-containing protein [Pseudomonas entomophila]|uniref:RodZ domain-containing protein n=1 Tax=Pseudomonas entomophila TaxID=312306 RepID=UPI0015E483C9|nr:RodZ family helix-turn-helix domain-containing protein [Pseudomonas entomophila]MBA1188611.1 helix-turn-helix domain-containing protein [Pseudomonas entomophila]